MRYIVTGVLITSLSLNAYSENGDSHEKALNEKNAISALIKETEYQKKNFETITEGRGEKYIQLLHEVTKIKGNKKIIQPLVDSIGLVGGVSIPDKLSDFGEEIILPLTVKYKEDGAGIKRGVLFTINALITKSQSQSNIIELSNENASVVKNLLMGALKDKSPFVRERAVNGLGLLGDASVIPALNEIITSDSYFMRRQIDGVKQKIWIVRDAAKLAITKIEKFNQ